MESLQIFRWILVCLGLYLAALPICALVWPTLPDRGAAFALPLSIVTVGVTAVWVGQLRYGPAVAILATGVPVLAGAIAFARGHRPSPRRAAEIGGVFALAMGFALVLRTGSPTITPQGGEQFLHFGVLNAVDRAPSLPPEDMWFAGESLRYYYGGHVTTVTIATVGGVELRYAYNLALATYFGILATAAYGLAGAIADRHGLPRRIAGTMSAFLVALGGTVTTPVRLAFGLLPDGVALRYGRPVFGAIRDPYEEAVLEQSNPWTWSWWDARYVVSGTLQETPLYSFIKGDHHGHTITTGFLLLAAALAYAYYLTPEEDRRRRLLLLGCGIPIVGGWLGVTNTWALPTAVGLAWLGLLTAPAHPITLLPLGGRLRSVLPNGIGEDRTPRGEASRLLWATVVAAIVGALSLAAATPFLLGGTPTNDGIGLFPPRTGLIGLLLLYGGPFLLFAAYLGWRWRAAPTLDLGSRPRTIAVLAVGTGLAGLLVGPLAFPALAVCGGLLLVGYAVVRFDDGAGFETTLLLAGVGLVLSMEVVHARVWPPEFDRWNTTLKVAIQAWTLTAIAAGIVATRLLVWGRDRAQGAGIDAGKHVSARDRIPGFAAIFVVGCVLLASAAFPVLAAGPEIADPPSDPTIDGFDGHERWYPDQLAAIGWLDERDGTPTVLEAPTRRSYTWGSVASTFTGLPTVVGWDHQRGYRGGEAFERRAAHADRMYTDDPVVVGTLLSHYDVQYIWVGRAEREAYDRIVAFDSMAGIDRVFENDGVRIYRVNPAETPGYDIDLAEEPGERTLSIDDWEFQEDEAGHLVMELTIVNEADASVGTNETGENGTSENEADENGASDGEAERTDSRTRSGLATVEATAGEERARAHEPVRVEPGSTVRVRLDTGLPIDLVHENGSVRIDLIQ
ncbi:DUF2298 domain-containing protein [Halopenitus sp. H-Gu1]|uniref:DUF2298 domain-containing protein n=1 Tax=Halopenitus sp. H-Gu1 TaxID=3242697 RepID=UPI00359DC813